MTSTDLREATPVKGEPVVEPDRVFLDAAESLRENGWCQKALQDQQGRMCLLGSLVLNPESGPIYDVIPGLGFKTLAATAAWNDHPDRTLGEVLERLTRAAWGEFEA